VLTTQATTDFGSVQAIITAVRVLRAEYNVAPGQSVNVTVSDASALVQRAIAAEGETIRRLAKIESLAIGANAGAAGGTKVLDDGTVITVPLGELVDLDKECVRLGVEATKLDALVEAQERKLSNEQFVARAPAAVIEKEREKLTSWRTQAESLREQRRSLGCAD